MVTTRAPMARQDLADYAIQPLEVVLGGRSIWMAFLYEVNFGLDRVLVDDDARLVTAESVVALEAVLLGLGVPADSDSGSVFIDGQDFTLSVTLDGLRPIPEGPLDSAMSKLLWDGWSLLDDICLSIARPLGFRGNLANRVLSKLFHGLNLPSITPAGESYAPIMTAKERWKFEQIINAGLERLASALRVEAPPLSD